ncbi:hypothetical protein [Nannocystis sp.]|uniref:hypothetical protein n=1 Tax=Nannocystis sp. TaxID=1962667 RepID=UPI0025D8E466|nr:hypothetical protein [Nannocystis sp.]MBK7829257.1 hypothetical protein [Nannocystis sp.]
MPKLSHEALVHLVRAAPEAIVGLLQRELGFESSAMAQPRITAAELVDLNLAEYRADAVIILGPDDTPTEAFVVEAQSDVDLRKRRTWPLYVAGLRARLGCPVTLVIIALDPRVAAWCAEPIDLGRQRGTIVPLVLGPAHIPIITDSDEARRAPELAVLSVAAHGSEPGAEYIALAALTAIRGLDSARELLYPDFILAMLGEVARAALELLMNPATYQFQSDFARKYIAMGNAEGKAQMLLKLLRIKGFTVSPELAARVESCKDVDQLDLWAERVVTATSLDDIFPAAR